MVCTVPVRSLGSCMPEHYSDLRNQYLIWSAVKNTKQSVRRVEGCSTFKKSKWFQIKIFEKKKTESGKLAVRLMLVWETIQLYVKNHEIKGRIFYQPHFQYWSRFLPDYMFCISKTLITVITQVSHNIYLNSIIVNFEGTDWGVVSRNTVQGWNFRKMIMVPGFPRKAENIYQFNS